MNLFWNYVPKNEYALERPSARHKGGLRSRLRKGRGRRAEGFREGRFGPLSSTSWNSMPKYDDWTVLSRYNHVKGLGSRMTKKRSDPNRNLYKISYNYSILEIAIYFQDPTKPSNAQRGHPVGHEESEKDDDEEMKRERERESLTYQTNTSNADSFSLISYNYRKIPEPEPDRFYRLSSLVAYPFSYPFFASQLLFPQEYTVVIENKNFSEKISLFSDVFLFVLRTELLLTMCPTWSAGVFFIYGHVLLSSVPDAHPRIRAPPLAAPYSGQTPEASPGAALAVMRDAHVLNRSPTRLKRTSH